MVEAPNFSSPDFKASSHTFYAHLRSEAPIHRCKLPDRQTAWLVTRYDDVLGALKDPRLVKDRQNAAVGAKQPWTPGFLEPLTRNMLDRDPPDHTRLRALVHRAFTPQRVERMEERVQAIADALSGRAARRGSMELIRDFALPLPTTILAEMLGVPVGDRHRFHRWSSRIVASDPSGWRMIRAVPSVVAFLRYIRRLVRARQEEPRDDLVSALVQAEEESDQLNEDELTAMIFLLLVAGHETTVNLIGNRFSLASETCACPPIQQLSGGVGDSLSAVWTSCPWHSLLVSEGTMMNEGKRPGRKLLEGVLWLALAGFLGVKVWPQVMAALSVGVPGDHVPSFAATTLRGASITLEVCKRETHAENG